MNSRKQLVREDKIMNEAFAGSTNASSKPSDPVAQTNQAGAKTKVVRIGKKTGKMFVALAEAYIASGNRPLSSAQCRKAVEPHTKSKNWSEPLRLLLNQGLLKYASGSAKRKERIPVIDVKVFVGRKLIWPQKAKKLPDVEQAPAAKTSTKAPKGLSPLQSRCYEACVRLSIKNGSRQVVGKDVADEMRKSGYQGNAYDVIKELEKKKFLKHVGGKKGSHRDPTTYELDEAGQRAVRVAAIAAVPHAFVPNGPLRSREDLRQRIAWTKEHIAAAADRPTRLANAQEALRRAQEDVAAIEHEPDPSELERQLQKLTLFEDNYDDLISLAKG